jgi:catechol 2,3-dioxygenase-like lactoylglutathione lyase family enzyme
VNDTAAAFDHYAIFVRDLARSTEFYAQVMGFEQISEPFKDDCHVWFRIGGNLQLHIITPRHTEVPPTADVHFAFRVPSLPTFIARLSRLQIAYGDQRPDGQIRVRPDGMLQIYFQDPDGYWIEVWSSPPPAST